MEKSIEGGTRAGSNLFHSFESFSVTTNTEVFFNNALDIQNIFNRVTGNSISNIDGLIRANGTANLFLLNPNGIIFGPNAQLNIGGSFLATTASSVRFADGTFFGSTNPQTSPLLTISVPVGLQMGSNPGNIVVQGPGHNLSYAPETGAIFRDNRPTGLQVASGHTLALLGGNLILEGGNLTAEDGRIELGSVGGDTLVTLTPMNQGMALSYPEIEDFQDISLSRAASVDASGTGGGDIFVVGRQVTLTDGSAILTLTEGAEMGGTLSVRASEVVEAIGTTSDALFSSGLFTEIQPGATGEGGDLTIETARLRVADGAQVSAIIFGSGKAGDLTVKATDMVELIGRSSKGFASGLFTDVSRGATGDGGNLTIETARLQVTDGAAVSTATFDSGKAGDLTVKASDTVELIGTSDNGDYSSGLFTDVEEATGDGGNLTIETARLLVANGAQVSSGTRGSGKAGNLTVKASDTVELIGRSAEGFASGLFTDVEEEATGDGGNLTIETARLHVADGAEVSATTFGSGKAGELTVKASDTVELIGTSTDGLPSGLFTQAQRGAMGDGGNLTIETARLHVADGAEVSSTTFGSGKAGDLIVKATDTVELIGTSDNDRDPSGLSASVQRGATGDGGNLTIETARLEVADGAAVSTATFGSGKAGDLIVKATNTVEVIGQSIYRISGLFASVQRGATGDGGNLTIETARLRITDGAQVSTSTSSSGKAGNVTVKATDMVELIGTFASVRFGSGLFASVELGATGDGGNLTIETARLRITDGAQVSTSTSGSGEVGNLTVKATDTVELIGASADGEFASGLFASVELGATGDGDNLTIETARLRITDGAQVSTSTSGSGEAGNLMVKATDTVELIGASADGEFVSGLFASVESEATGDGGNVNIETTRLQVADGAIVTVESFGKGEAGSLIVDADSILLENSSNLIADTKAGGGSIELRSPSITLRRGSSITTNATGGESGGDIEMQTDFLQLREGSRITTNAEGIVTGTEIKGGNITLDADILVALENSDISANSDNFFGGQVFINTQGIFGTQFRDATTSESDITATGPNPQFSGTVQITTPDVDPSSGLIELPQNLVDATALVDRRCESGQDASRFVVTGRGGLPPSPDQTLSGEAFWEDLRLPDGTSRVEEFRSQSEFLPNEPELRTEIVEAQGWSINTKGEVVLTAATSTATPHPSALAVPTC